MPNLYTVITFKHFFVTSGLGVLGDLLLTMGE